MPRSTVGLHLLPLNQSHNEKLAMTTYKSTESKQLWQHRSGQVLLLDVVAPLDETDSNAEYRYSSQGMDIGSDSDFYAKNWVKIDESGYVGPLTCPIYPPDLL